MKYNRDGTPYCLDTVMEEMQARFSRDPFADVTDFLGSDWGVGYISIGTPPLYQSAALARAIMIYRN